MFSKFQKSGSVLKGTILLSFAIGAFVASAQAAPSYLADSVAPEPAHPGGLRASEVPIRGLTPRTKGANEPHDTLEAIRGFHATRLEWIYGLTPDFVSKVRAMKVSVSGTISTGTGDGLSETRPDWQSYYQIQDLAGRPTTAPWMRTWNGGWLDVNHPEVRQAYLSHAKRLVDMGASDIQRDDGAGNLAAVRWGAPFGDKSIQGFRAYLKKRLSARKLAELGIKNIDTFDYRAHLKAAGAPVGDGFGAYPGGELKSLFRDFQEQVMLDFYVWLKKSLDAHAGRHVPVSFNNSGAEFDAIHQMADWWIGELSATHATPEYLHNLAARVRAEKRAQTLTMPLKPSPEETPGWMRLIRQSMATIYAVGMHMEMPWDTYLPAPSAPRYFGKPKDYADLSGFIRANAALFDGYCSASAVGGLLETPERQRSGPAQVWAEGGMVYAFARAKPRDRAAPVVMHLVDWRDTPSGFTVTLDPARFFGGRPMRARLLTPPPYVEAAHASASRTGDYRHLSTSVVLATGRFASLQIPALNPWGLLVLEPLPVTTDTPAPVVRPLPPPAEGVEVSSQLPGGRLAVTTDGSEPRPGAAGTGAVTVRLAQSPLRLRALAWREGRPSVETSLVLPPVGESPQGILSNGTFDERLESWRTIAPTENALEVTARAKGSPFRAGPAARIEVKEPNGVIYSLRLVQPVSLERGAVVRLTGKLVADRPARVRIGLQGSDEPHAVVILRHYDLQAGKVADLDLFARCAESIDALVQFDLGECPAGTVLWLDDVAVTTSR